MGLADAAIDGAQDQGRQRGCAIHPLAQRIEPAANVLLASGAALVDSRQSSVLLHDPEEHDTGQQSAQRADVNGDNVHPLRGPRLDAQGDHAAHRADDDHGQHTVGVELLLQEGHGSLIQVHDGADACEQHADVEDHTHDPAAGHGVEHIDQIDEHQAGAALHSNDAVTQNDCHGRDDDDGSQQSGDGVEQGHVAGRGRQVLILGQIGAVDHGAVARHRQGEECLTECEDPDLRIQQALGLEGEDVLVALAGAGQSADIDAQDHKQEEQSGHHDLIGLFNAVAHAECHDGQRGHQTHDQPYAVADAEDTVAEHHAQGLAQSLCLGSGAAEGAADGRHIGAHSVQAAGNTHPAVLEDPAHDHGVADSQHHRADDGERADGLAQPLITGAFLGSLAEGDHGAALRPTAQCEFLNDTGRTDQKYEQEVGDQERHAPELLHHDGEAPNITHTNGRANAGQNKAPFALKTVAIFQSCVFV